MARRHRRGDRLRLGDYRGLHFQADAEGTIHAFGDEATGSPSPGPGGTPPASPSPLPEAFELINTFDAETSGLQVAAGMDIGPDGNLYVANPDNHETPGGQDEVLVLDAEGDIVRRWGEHGTGPGQFDFQRHGGNDPTGALAVGDDGSVYVADYVNARIQKFTGRGEFVQQWGRYGDGDGQFLGPYDIAVSEDGSVYVVDEVRDDIQKFDNDGRFLLRIGQDGTGPGELRSTGGITVDAVGAVHSADYGNNRVQAWDSPGIFLWSLGERGSDPGELTGPNDIALDETGSLYVVETKSRVQVFDRQRRPVAEWTVPVVDDEIAFIALDGEGHAYVSDYFGQHIYKLRIVPLPDAEG